MKFRLALLAATVLAAPVTFSHAASAQPVTGPYVSLGGGYNIQDSEKVKDIYLDRAPVDAEAKIFTKNGYDVMGSVGYGFGNGFRAEIEGDYIRGDFDKVKEGGVAYRTAGSERRFGGFLNAYYDLDIGLPFLYPYLGGGIGLLDDDFHHFGVNPNLITKERVALAYQGIAGVSVPIAYVPGLSVTLEYRFVALANSRKYSGSFAGPTESFKVGHEYNNEINAGLRYELFQPVPPAPAPEASAPEPAAAPAPAPAKTYLVFFDWDKYNLSPRAMQIIAQAASDSHTSDVTTINVSGYTDTSGTPNYNMGLSERRAQAVAAQLVTDGVSQSEIEIHAYGETHLLVPTGPGVREPQNRRVEIVLD